VVDEGRYEERVIREEEGMGISAEMFFFLGV
jgi:hypothetical protein